MRKHQETSVEILPAAEPETMPGPFPSFPLLEVPPGGDYESVIDHHMRERQLVVETRSLQRHWMNCAYEIGVRLRELRRMSEHGHWMEILSTELGGMHPQQARRLVAFAEGCDQFPRLRNFAEANYTKALTLFQGMESEDLQELNDTGALGADQEKLVLDDVQRMSIHQLRHEVKRRRKDIDAVVAEETKILKRERDLLIKERDALARQVDAGPVAPEEIRKMAADLAEHARGAARLAQRIEEVSGDTVPGGIAIGVQSSLFAATRAADTAFARWTERYVTPD